MIFYGGGFLWKDLVKRQKNPLQVVHLLNRDNEKELGLYI